MPRIEGYYSQFPQPLEPGFVSRSEDLSPRVTEHVATDEVPVASQYRY